MKIATLQLAPKLGDLQGNIEKANGLLKGSAGAATPDILVLPEMALTGYNFPSLEAVKPYLEPVGGGPSASWARETAKRLKCKVCVGYPEIEETPQSTDQTTYYNSLLVVDERGEVIHNYRKSFLYYTDETWAAEGQVERGFKELAIQEQQVATSFGICMDINPYKFEAPFDKWEFASRVLDSKTQLVILSMAWLTLLSREELDALKYKPEMDTFNYWLQRFWPLLQKRMKHEIDIDGKTGSPKKVVIVFANRAGEEPPADETKSEARYAGTSAIIAVTQKPKSGSEQDSESSDNGELPFDVKILCWDLLGAAEEGVCFADTTADPKMVFAIKKSK
ncbi:hypothetical protein N7452_004503 [Penicillium brevicompactum]|uniref:CN hydrolase domain-containing protein n=1 Tax=Penicillium brevicompactum TaxID=5074 RepID=A0A9W9UFL7_PENBR|nr:hypothetical protein N7452_004503 [Penicillium brevicompactum]